MVQAGEEGRGHDAHGTEVIARSSSRQRRCPTPRERCNGQPRQASVLQNYAGTHGLETVVVQNASPHVEGHRFLPPALDASLDSHLTSMALEDWKQSHMEWPGQRAAYESKMLAIQAGLKMLGQLSLRLRPPNEALTALAYDLFRCVFSTLLPRAKCLCNDLVQHLEDTIYSEESATMDVAPLAEVLSQMTNRLPHFVMVRKQQATLEKMEQRARTMQTEMDNRTKQRRRMLELVKRLQGDEHQHVKRWLFKVWAVTFRSRKLRIRRMATLVLTTTTDVSAPFASWRLYVVRRRLGEAHRECELVDKKASTVANQITHAERKNEAEQQRLQETLQEAALLANVCAKEKDECDRLQEAWDMARPELLMSVFAQALELFYGIVIRDSHLSGLEVRQRLIDQDVSPLLVGVPPEMPLEDVPAEDILVCWVNRALAKGRSAIEELLCSAKVTQAQHQLLQSVQDLRDVRDLAVDMRDSRALCVLLAVLNARREGRAFDPQDLLPLEEQDLELRAARLCGLLRGLVHSRQACCLLDARALASAESGPTGAFLACVFLQDPMLAHVPSSVDANGKASLRAQLEVVLVKVGKHAGGGASEPLEDPSPLLRSGENFQTLVTIEPENLLLRWANMHLASAYPRQVENFSTDLQDGIALGLLLAAVAPEAMLQPLATDFRERLEQILAAAVRCTEFELLTVKAVVDGQADLLACFLAQLFLSQPGLKTKPNSPLSMRVRSLERLCRSGLDVLDAPGNDAEVLRVCAELKAHWSEFASAAQMVSDTAWTMQTLYDRMRTFLGDTLAHRVRGQPRAMPDAKEARDLVAFTSVHRERLQAMLGREGVDAGAVGRVEEALRSHFGLLREAFRNYATSTGGSTGLKLEGLVRLFQDCKLRSKDLVTRHLEAIFRQHVSMCRTPDHALTPTGFVEVLVALAHLRFRCISNAMDDQLLCLIEQHLKPFAGQQKLDGFRQMVHDQRVRRVLEGYSKELEAVFSFYAALDAFSDKPLAGVSVMCFKDIELLLEHCQLFDTVLTNDIAYEVLEGIHSCACQDNPDFTEVQVDDEVLSFMEFLDFLVVVAAFKYPEPFRPFHRRVRTFFRQFLSTLWSYWSKKQTLLQVGVLQEVPQVNKMLELIKLKLNLADIAPC